ncbi:MAG: GNAT family N-acetyltransferase [Terricaulis sp.]
MSDIVYRLAEAADAAALAAFAAGSFVETFGHLYPPEDLATYLSVSYAAAIQRAELADPAIRAWLALREGVIVGYAMAGPVDMKIAHAERDCELYRLYVDKDVKGAGVAHALMRDVMAWAKEQGAEALWLSVWENNERAQRFYKRYGFDHIGEHKFMVGRVADRDLIWRLAL